MTMEISLFLEKLRQEVRHYKVPVVDLISVQTKDPFKILVATILSSRTKDETTAGACSRLFKVAPDMESLAGLTREDIQELIYPVGFYKSKAGYLFMLYQALEKFGYQIPGEIDDLMKLPGVGRKTANLVRSIAFDKDAICVDTHVHRIMNIWGYVNTKTPLETEMELRKKLPLHHWREVNTILVAFGQGTCRPISPHCDRCVIASMCPQKGVKPRKIKNKMLNCPPICSPKRGETKEN
ncbi:MAG: endonuclease III [Desulfamplus sp.]|nr:endonuclease III [Desulfamplus sp.]